MGGNLGLLIKILCITSRQKLLIVKESYNINVSEVILVYYLKFYVSRFVLMEINSSFVMTYF